MQALVGHRFPGGSLTVAHWENVLLTDATGAPPLPDRIVHPAYLFHGPIAAAGTSLADLFALFRAESDEAIRAGGYEWTINRPLIEGETYATSGEVTHVERKVSKSLGPMDVTSFRIDLHDQAGELVGGATGAIGDDVAHRLGRKILRNAKRRQRNAGGTGQQTGRCNH